MLLPSRIRFVTLDTTSRDVMMEVVLALLSKSYPCGSKVQARLKALPVLSHDEGPLLTPVYPEGGGYPVYTEEAFLGTISEHQLPLPQQPIRQKKKKNRNVEKRKQRKIDRKAAKAALKAAALAEADPDAANSGTKPPLPPTPLGLTEDAFPVLEPEPSPGRKVVERVPQDRPEDDLGKHRASNSDTSSTASASTSSSMYFQRQTNQNPKVGYAAALTNRQQQSSSPADSVASSDDVSLDAPSHHGEDEPPKQQESPASVTVHPSWGETSTGSGGSFADIVRKQSRTTRRALASEAAQ
jgi:hypothetical protein